MRVEKKISQAERRYLNKQKETLAEMVERYKDKPTDTATYEIEGHTFIVTSHFVGEKNLGKEIHDYAFQRALNDTD